MKDIINLPYKDNYRTLLTNNEEEIMTNDKEEEDIAIENVEDASETKE